MKHYISKSDLLFDKNHIWHPYTSMKNPLPCYPVISAYKTFLQLNNGKKLIDGMSSWWTAIHGYNHPRLNKALKNQIKKMSHVMFGGITHLPAIKLCRKLVSMTPKNLECVFLSDSGSISIEVALKMAIQYWKSKKQNRNKFLSLLGGYHGDTFAAMSVSDPKNSIHNLYHGYIKKQHFFQFSKYHFNNIENSNNINSFKKMILKYNKKLAAVILEPILQGVGGMRFYHPDLLKNIREICSYYKILLIIDEIATGFGRLGKLFAFEYAKISPDILCLGKSLTGGVITLAATICSRKIANVISNGNSNCFMHGPTFMANPLSCAVANENLKIISKNIWKNQIRRIEKQLKLELLPLIQQFDVVLDVRVLGGVGVVECNKIIDIAKMQAFFVSEGVWIRPFKNLIYIIPSYIITLKSLKKLISVIKKSLNIKNLFVN